MKPVNLVLVLAAALLLPAAVCAQEPVDPGADPGTAAPAEKAGSKEKSAAAEKEKPAAAEKETCKVEKGTLTLAVDAEGTFETTDPVEIRLRPKAYSGDLTIVAAAAHGARVRPGEVLLQLDPAPLQKLIDAARNELVAAKANLKKAEEDVRLGKESDELALAMAKTELANAETELKWWDEVEGRHMLEGVDLELQATSDNIGDQQDELDQLKKMYKAEELTTATADIVVRRALRGLDRSKVHQKMQVEASRKVKEIDHPSGRQKLLYALDQTREKLALLGVTQEHERVTRQTALVTAQAAAAQAEEHVADLTGDLAGFTVKAPAAGILFYGQLTAGAWQNNDPRALRPTEKATAQQVLMTLVVPGRMRVKLELPESELFWVKPGMKASVVPVALDELKYDGTCGPAAITGVAGDKGGGFDLVIALPPVDERLVPGLKASVHIDIAELKDVLLVPTNTVTHGKVKVKTADGKEEVRAVVVGKSDGQKTEIKEGLHEGDEVIAAEKK